MSAGKPCAACPWVPGRPLSDALTDVEREAAKAGGWFCCHVDLNTCRGAANYAEREAKP